MRPLSGVPIRYEVVLVFSLPDSIYRFSLSLRWARKNRFLEVQIILSLAHSQAFTALSSPNPTAVHPNRAGSHENRELGG